MKTNKHMIRKLFFIVLISTVCLSTKAQESKRDTVKVSLAKTSEVIFTIKDRSDLEILKHYDFQSMFQDILLKLEKADTTLQPQAEGDTTETILAETDENWDADHHAYHEDDDDDYQDWDWDNNRNHRRRTSQSFNFDLGTNNYLENGKFPDAEDANYSVRPWGSWYFALNSTQRTRLAKNFFLEWAGGMSWYAFKFQKDNILIVKDETGVSFEQLNDPNVDYIKSKLGACYVTASIVPVLDFGGHSRKSRMWDSYGSNFRIGIGPYIGYRISSRSKLVYEVDGEKEKDKNIDSLYLNGFRYGARLQLGIRSTDFFFNYDLNELFATGKGPKLNAFSFGIIF
ncbi:MAG: hypothetical protein JNM57_13955 [Cyclobacteriaceae bacterium]|nr:hypothetical protein [Cyclobacteriaceae bacterium]